MLLISNERVELSWEPYAMSQSTLLPTTQACLNRKLKAAMSENYSEVWRALNVCLSPVFCFFPSPPPLLLQLSPVATSFTLLQVLHKSLTRTAGRWWSGDYRASGCCCSEITHVCAEVVDEENKLQEEDREETTSPLSAPHQPVVPFNPCEG